MTEYETKTIHYIADEFKKLGLQPANGDSYFQPVKEISTFTRPVKNKNHGEMRERLYGFEVLG